MSQGRGLDRTYDFLLRLVWQARGKLTIQTYMRRTTAGNQHPSGHLSYHVTFEAVGATGFMLQLFSWLGINCQVHFWQARPRLKFRYSACTCQTSQRIEASR